MQQTSTQHIIIVGAGVAGLMAAKELSAHFKITILEARNQPGGRIRTIYNDDHTHLEAGAEFVHGKLPITLELLKKAGLSYSPVKGKMFNVKDGQWQESEEMIEGWDELLEKMKEEKEDMTVLAFLNKHYAAEQSYSLRKRITRYAEGFDLADISRVSLKALLKEWTNESEDNFRVDQGYMALVKFMEKDCLKNGCTIHYNTPVKLVEWDGDTVKAFKDPETVFEADRILITIPLGLLQSREATDAIRFVPSVDAYVDAAQQMGYGSVIKFILQFKRPFWQDRHKEIAFIISEENVPTWWTQTPDLATLTGWLGGPPADELINSTNEQLLAIALKSLASIFQLSYAELQDMLIASQVFNWARDEWADGGYSYATPATARSHQLLFNTPPGNKIFFAGEAFYEGTAPGTVEAALTSACHAAFKIQHLIPNS